jgi:hypothetical protein
MRRAEGGPAQLVLTTHHHSQFTITIQKASCCDQQGNRRSSTNNKTAALDKQEWFLCHFFKAVLVQGLAAAAASWQ